MLKEKINADQQGELASIYSKWVCLEDMSVVRDDLDDLFEDEQLQNAILDMLWNKNNPKHMQLQTIASLMNTLSELAAEVMVS